MASNPLLPPSPVSGRSHVLLPVNESVPLSCVPVIATLSGSYGLTEMLFICSVLSPAFMTVNSLGIWLSHALHSGMSPGLMSARPRSSHWSDASAHSPLVRMMPPSEPTKNLSGAPGTNASACWSGCIDSPPTSPVTSVHVAPAFIDMRTARPLERAPTTCGA